MTEPGRRSSGTPAPLRLLFVCTANISRSPYAERRARQVLDGWNVEISSAGIPGYPGRDMDEEMAKLLPPRGADATGHVSRAVTDEILENADLVLTFEFGHHMKLLDAHPEHGHKVLGIGQLAAAVRRLEEAGERLPAVDDVDDLTEVVLRNAGANSMTYDVDDPYRRGTKVAIACADEIDRHLDRILPFIAGADLPRLAASEAAPPKKKKRWPWG